MKKLFLILATVALAAACSKDSPAEPEVVAETSANAATGRITIQRYPLGFIGPGLATYKNYCFEVRETRPNRNWIRGEWTVIPLGSLTHADLEVSTQYWDENGLYMFVPRINVKSKKLGQYILRANVYARPENGYTLTDEVRDTIRITQIGSIILPGKPDKPISDSIIILQ